jgi:hypothetical protein
MIIRLSKGKKAKPPTLTCVRDDGTLTWQRSSEHFAHHDLIHYAVETALGYREAFLGLVAAGKDLDAFGTRNGVKDVYTLQEGWAEGLVGLLQLPAGGDGTPLGDEELIDLMAKICIENGVPVPPIAAEQLGCIRAQIRALHETWDQLPEGGVMELTF